MALNIHPDVQLLFEELVFIRRQIHMHPELMFDLPNTTNLVSSYLKNIGIEVIQNIGISGIVGIIRGIGPCILLRADMDALPLIEENDVEYKSKSHGKMHACGHDAHVAMLLIAAKVLWSKRDLIKGSVKFMFQPAEEGGTGAMKMIEDNTHPVLEAEPIVDEVYALHVSNGNYIGSYLLADVYMSCFCDFFEISVIAKAGCSSPVIVSELILALQNIVSRNIDNSERAVISVTCFHAGEAFDKVPETCKLKGTVRSFSTEVRELVFKRISDILNGFEITCECRTDFKVIPVNPPIKNDLKCVEKAEKILRKISPDGVRDRKSLMIGEDFSYLTDRRPGAFVCLGTATSGLENHSIHSSLFDINERAMLIGSSFFVDLILDQLSTTRF